MNDHHIPARTGIGLTIEPGQRIRIIDVDGGQPADLWAYNKNDPGEYLSAPHTRIGVMRLLPRSGEAFRTNHRREILRILEDPVPVHDFLSAACDRWRYEELGHDGWHASCEENHVAALREHGRTGAPSVQPFNVWTNFHLHPDGTFEIRRPATKAGDHILLEACMPAFVVISACPQDITLTANLEPTDLRVEVE